MICVTGDIHGDITRFNNKNIRKLRKNDVLIVCGDFGFIWDGTKKEQRILKKLGKKRYYILFADGCHENFDLLNEYPVTDFCGGKVRVISGRLMHAGRGSIFELDGKKVTLAEALGTRQFGKVYILLGINEIGAYTAADWAAQYKSLLDLVREKQPDAVIFIQSIFHTTQKKSDSSYFKNEVINERNAAIAQLADGKTIFYLDLNPLFDDENGALRADYSGDGVHVRAPYYVQWRDELYRFGVVK